MRTTYAEIKFGLLDTTAATDGTTTSNGQQYFVELVQLEDEIPTITPIQTCEKNQTLLDGTFELIQTRGDQDYGFWSSEISDAEGNFETNPILTRQFNEYHTTAGLTLTFAGDSLPKAIIITYYQNETVLGAFTHEITASRYYATDIVENYNKITFEFTGTQVPYRYIKMSELLWGIIKVWSQDAIVSASILEELNLTSNEVSINEFEFEIYDKDNAFDILNPKGVYATLQQRQPLTVTEYINNVPVEMGTFYLSEWESTVNKIASFKASDMLGVLDNIMYRQKTMWSNTNASSIFADIFSQGNFENYVVSEEISSLTLNGYVPIISIREALHQVCFALRCTINAGRDGKIHIERITTSEVNAISKGSKANTKLIQETLVNSVMVQAYNFVLGSSTQLYSGSLGVGKYEISVEASGSKTCTGGTIVEQGVNYIIVNVTSAGTVTVSGAKYIESVTKYVKTAEIYNNLQQVEVSGVYCISNANGQQVADYLYNDYQKRITQEFKLILEDEQVGNTVDVEIENTIKQGIITRLETNLTNGYISECTVRSE